MAEDESDDRVGCALNSWALIFVAFCVGVFAGGWLTDHLDWDTISRVVLGN